MSFATVETLSKEHEVVFQRLPALVKPADNLEKGAGGVQEIKDFSTFIEKEITVHFDIEEKALFPVLGRMIGTDSGPIYVMLSEHDDLSPKFKELVELSKKLNGNDPAINKRAAYLTKYIANVLYNHAQKEEQILFPFALNALAPEQIAEVDSIASKIKVSHQ